METQIIVCIILFCSQYVLVFTACTTGWFGSRCQYKCHCTSNTCDDNGLCFTGSCASGWFGPLCQFQDLARLGSTISTNLTDGDDNTCKSLQNFMISWSISYEVASIRVKLATHDPISDIRLAVKETNSASSFTPCTNQTMSTVNDFTTVIYCSYSKTVQAVQIDFGKTRSVCTVNINGGRNVALKQETWQSSNYNDVYTSSKAVDGNIDGNIVGDSCTHTNVSNVGTWRVTFPQPITINRYVIYNRNEFQDRLRGFTLTSYSSSNQPVFTYTDPNTNAAVYTVTSTSKSNVSYVQIIAKTNVMTLCEVEIFEGCPIGWFGPSCQYKCHCTNNYCDVSGGCYGGSTCDNGWVGPLCQEPCLPGFYGENCAHPCSTNCSSKLCDRFNGSCFSCIRGMQGPFCNTPYMPGSFGDECRNQAPDRFAEGVGTGIGVMCFFNILVVAIICIVRRTVCSSFAKSQSSPKQERKTENGKDTAYDESPRANASNSFDTVDQSTNHYDTLSMDCHEKSQYESVTP